MQMRNLAVCLTVDDVPAVADFYITHFGFRAAVAVESFAKLAHDSLDTELCLMQTGSEVLPADTRHRRADGVILAFVVQDAKAEEARLRAAGVAISMPLRDEEWGERLFQIQDPHGTPVELVEWLTPTPA